jgi:uncharacterized protein (TIGR03000 family)
MKKFVLVGAIACGFLLALSAQPANAQRFSRYRGGSGFYGYGSNYTPSTYGYSGSGYSGWANPNASSYYASPYNGTYSRGWPSTYNNTSMYSYSSEPYRLGSITPAAWDVTNPQYSSEDRRRMTYRSTYSPPEVGTNEANIRVIVPSGNARVFFDDSKTEQTGMERLFASPPLEPNKEYTYTVRAEWTENGKEMNKAQDVKVKAGRTSMVDFRNAGTTANNPNETLLRPRDGDRKDDKRDDRKDDKRDDKRIDRPDKPD